MKILAGSCRTLPNFNEKGSHDRKRRENRRLRVEETKRVGKRETDIGGRWRGEASRRPARRARKARGRGQGMSSHSWATWLLKRRRCVFGVGRGRSPIAGW